MKLNESNCEFNNARFNLNDLGKIEEITKLPGVDSINLVESQLVKRK